MDQREAGATVAVCSGGPAQSQCPFRYRIGLAWVVGARARRCGRTLGLQVGRGAARGAGGRQASLGARAKAGRGALRSGTRDAARNDVRGRLLWRCQGMRG